MLDSDAFVLLSAAGALRSAISALGFESARCERLPHLPGMLRGRAFKYPEPVLRSVLHEAEQMPAIRAATKQEIKAVSLLRGKIDPGELQVLAVINSDPEAYFLSGDEKWMRQLCSLKHATRVRNAFAGRIICLVSVLGLLLDVWGFKESEDRFRRFDDHRTLRIFFSGGRGTTEEHLRAALRSHMNELTTSLGTDFLLLRS